MDKIDKDGDGFVTEEELINWIKYVQHKYITDDTDRMWEEHDSEGDTLTWESYRKRTYGYEHGRVCIRTALIWNNSIQKWFSKLVSCTEIEFW